MRSRRMTTGKVVLGFGVSVALVACTSSTPSDPTDPEDPSETGTASAFRFAINFEPDNWNPMLVPNTTYTQLPYEGLMEFAEDGITVVPALAEDWTLTAEELTLTLREGVTFHDGTAFDADAVLANIEHILQSGTEWATTLGVIESATAEDEHTVRFDLSAPNPSLPFNLAGRGAVMISPAAIEDRSWEQVPVGTGPYALNTSETVDGSVYVFDRFEGYHSPDEIGPGRVEVHFIEDGTTRYNALATGQVDAARIDPAMVQEAESAGLGTQTWPALAYHLFFFGRDELFADARVRQAMCLAMPLEEIDTASYEGLSTFPTQRLSEEDPGYAGDVERYPFDIDAASELMAQAGNPDISFQMPMMSGQEGTYALIQQRLGEIGIDVELLPMNAAQYFSVYFTGDYPLIFNQANSEDGGMYNYYTVRFAEDGDLNPAAVPPPAELAELFDQAMAATDETEQNASFQDMSRLIHDEALDCGYMNIPQTIAYDDELVTGIPVTTFAPSALRYKDVRFLD